MSSIYLRGKVWQIQFERDGKYVQRSLKTRNKAEARSLQRELDHALCRPGFYPDTFSEGGGETVGDLIEAFESHAASYYRDATGEATSTILRVRAVLDSLRPQAVMSADAFRPSTLRRIRDGWVAAGKARSTINQYHSLVVQIFRWGVGQEMVKPETLTALEAVELLSAGRSGARETDRVLPVPDADLEAVRSIAPALVRDMIDLQVLTCARPGELKGLKVGDIIRTGEVWFAALSRHKSAHKGKTRTLYFGPQAQVLLAPYLDGRRPEDYVFTRHSPEWFAKTIGALCKQANVPIWTPNQLRHLGATRVRAAVNAETASILLGHSNLSTTEIYAEKNDAAARAAVALMG